MSLESSKHIYCSANNVFSWLARKLVGNQSLEFVAAPALAPPEVTVDQAVLEEYQREMEAASAMPLPDEDDGDL
jgi:GTP-binding nuclear protein Ran